MRLPPMELFGYLQADFFEEKKPTNLF